MKVLHGGDLSSWDDIVSCGWPALLVGNGLSINVWKGFAYDALFDAAALDEAAESLFSALDTNNFEQALECLNSAAVALRALGIDSAEVDSTYESIRDALLKAVRDSHVKWNDFKPDAHTRIAKELDRYSHVFSTCYDLSIYWSLMWERSKEDERRQMEDRVRAKDFFWGKGGVFDPDDVDIRERGVTRLYYVHGALHLWQADSTSQNGKWASSDGKLLALLEQYGPDSLRRPLFVSEGTSAAKLRTIRQSPYLSFCLERLRNSDENIVVFGHSLSVQDTHIVEALDRGNPRKVAISMRPSMKSDAIIREKARLCGLLPRHEVQFFDSTSHPLGGPELKARI